MTTQAPVHHDPARMELWGQPIPGLPGWIVFDVHSLVFDVWRGCVVTIHSSKGVEYSGQATEGAHCVLVALLDALTKALEAGAAVTSNGEAVLWDFDALHEWCAA